MDTIITAPASCKVRILGPQGNFVDRIHGTRDHNNVRGLLRNAE